MRGWIGKGGTEVLLDSEYDHSLRPPRPKIAHTPPVFTQRHRLATCRFMDRSETDGSCQGEREGENERWTSRNRRTERERWTQRASAGPRELSGESKEGMRGWLRERGGQGKRLGVQLLLGKRRQRRKGEVQGKGGESESRSVSSRSSTSPTSHNTVRLPSTASIDWTPYCLH